jgi:hypothetical protein
MTLFGTYTSATEIPFNYRKGKKNTVHCYGFKIYDANATGRRLSLQFIDKAGNVIDSRRVYKEWVDPVIDEYKLAKKDFGTVTDRTKIAKPKAIISKKRNNIPWYDREFVTSIREIPTFIFQD